jgi:hypothetical protein
MAAFSTESDVRLKFQLEDTTLVPSDLVTQSIDDAHEVVLRHLHDDVDTGSPAAALILGETLLSGALLLHSLSSNDAFVQKNVSVGGNRIAEGGRFDALRSAAATAEDQAWYLLQPYLADEPERFLLGVTDTRPVLGES